VSVFRGDAISVAKLKEISLRLHIICFFWPFIEATCKNVMNSIQHKVQLKIASSLKVIEPCNFFNVSVYVCLGQMLMKFQGPKNYFFI
jgi:hypothetical protein